MASFNSDDALSKIQQNFSYQSCVVLLILLFLLWILWLQLIGALIHCSYQPQQKWSIQLTLHFSNKAKCPFIEIKPSSHNFKHFNLKRLLLKPPVKLQVCDLSGRNRVQSCQQILTIFRAFTFTNVCNDRHHGTINTSTFSNCNIYFQINTSCQNVHGIKMQLASDSVYIYCHLCKTHGYLLWQ